MGLLPSDGAGGGVSTPPEPPQPRPAGLEPSPPWARSYGRGERAKKPPPRGMGGKDGSSPGPGPGRASPPGGTGGREVRAARGGAGRADGVGGWVLALGLGC